jgi:hypothetical protein
MAGRRCEQGPINCAKLRRRALAAQHRDLVAQDQQLELLGVQATATPNECAQQGPERDIEEGEGHYRDPPNPPTKGPTRVLAPYTAVSNDIRPLAGRNAAVPAFGGRSRVGPA